MKKHLAENLDDEMAEVVPDSSADNKAEMTQADLDSLFPMSAKDKETLAQALKQQVHLT